MADLRADCPADDGAWTGFQSYRTRRVLYNLIIRSGSPLMNWAPPDTYVPMFTRQSEGNDPSICTVVLHSLSCVRQPPIGGGVVIPDSLATPGGPAPRVSLQDPAVPFVLPLDCDQRTVGRGGAVPQYRIRFRDGSNDWQTIFVDGSTVVSLPCSQVEIHLAVPSIDLVIDPQPGTHATTEGLIVDTFASASVSWSSRAGLGGGPAGLSTWTERALVVDNGAPVGSQKLVSFFERPPFARRACVLWSPDMLVGGALAMDVRYVAGLTFGLEELATGTIIAGKMTSPAFNCIPSAATHVRVAPGPLAPDGVPFAIVWEIGVE